MRIIRNHDHDDEDPDDFEPNDPKDQGEKLADEVSDFLAAVAERAPFPTGQDAPGPTEQAMKPALHLVKTDASADREVNDEWTVAAIKSRGPRPRLVRAGVGGSAVVIALSVFATWGEPSSVVVPISVYGFGWIAYLWWNAALRPPIPQAVAVITTAFNRSIAAIFSLVVGRFRALLNRADAARTRHETTRTATT
ncbi:hypothetical protein ABZ942_19795 [Nocardia sp. NPDC046473]|uniref:hypothetical protein n=1 Tax=Nocardia sp. NPDC046473 TaxID=3155733 RepID=UPI003401E2BF